MFVGDALVLLPFTMAAFVGAWSFLAPYLVGKLGSALAGSPTGFDRFIAFGGAHRWPIVVLAGLAVAGVWAGARTSLVTGWLRRGGAMAQLGFKVSLILPLIGAVAVLLLSVVSPVVKALSVKP